MILYNITFCVDESVREEFIQYIIKTVIPATSRAGMRDHILSAIQGNRDRNELTGDYANSMALQMKAPSQAVLDNTAGNILPRLFREVSPRWQSKVTIFDTTLDIIHDSTKTSNQ